MRRERRWMGGVVCASIVILLTCSRATSAAPFTNLNFEQATVIINDPMFGFLDWPLALPGWVPHSGVPETAKVFFGSPHLGMAPYTLLIDHQPFSPIPGKPASAGRYSLEMRGSVEPGFRDEWISQTGDVPATAKAIEFVVWGQEPRIYLDNVRIPLVEIDEPGAFARFAGNITAFAGKTAELKILYPEPVSSDEEVLRYRGILDNFSFTQRVVVPEPGGLVLAAVGMLGAVAIRRRRRGM